VRLRILVTLLVVGLFSGAASEAQAGAIRFAGKKIARGTAAVAGVTADGAQAAGGGMAVAGKASGGALKAGAVGVGKGVAATPGLTARGAKALGKGVSKVIW